MVPTLKPSFPFSSFLLTYIHTFSPPLWLETSSVPWNAQLFLQYFFTVLILNEGFLSAIPYPAQMDVHSLPKTNAL